MPKDPNDDRNTVLEIRSGEGGEEAALFAADIYRMLARYAEKKKWTVEVLKHERERLLAATRKWIALVFG